MDNQACVHCEKYIDEDAEFIKYKKMKFCSKDCKEGWIDKQSDDAIVDPDDIDFGLDEPVDHDDPNIDDFDGLDEIDDLENLDDF